MLRVRSSVPSIPFGDAAPTEFFLRASLTSPHIRKFWQSCRERELPDGVHHLSVSNDLGFVTAKLMASHDRVGASYKQHASIHHAATSPAQSFAVQRE